MHSCDDENNSKETWRILVIANTLQARPTAMVKPTKMLKGTTNTLKCFRILEESMWENVYKGRSYSYDTMCFNADRGWFSTPRMYVYILFKENATIAKPPGVQLTCLRRISAKMKLEATAGLKKAVYPQSNLGFSGSIFWAHCQCTITPFFTAEYHWDWHFRKVSIANPYA